MKRVIQFAICMLFVLPVAIVPLHAGEVLDSVVATVDHKPILRSEWDDSVCFEMFMKQKPLAQMSETDRTAALQHLIDRQLLKLQMGESNALRPSNEDIDNDVAKVRAQVPGASDERRWQELLAGYYMTPDSLREHLATELEIMNFVEVRLRPNAHVKADEIAAYYQNQLLPDLRKNGAAAVSLEEVEPKIRELLTQQRMDELLDAWLHNLRQQAEIHSSVPVPGLNVPVEPEGASGLE